MSIATWTPRRRRHRPVRIIFHKCLILIFNTTSSRETSSKHHRDATRGFVVRHPGNIVRKKHLGNMVTTHATRRLVNGFWLDAAHGGVAYLFAHAGKFHFPTYSSKCIFRCLLTLDRCIFFASINAYKQTVVEQFDAPLGTQTSISRCDFCHALIARSSVIL